MLIPENALVISLVQKPLISNIPRFHVFLDLPSEVTQRKSGYYLLLGPAIYPLPSTYFRGFTPFTLDKLFDAHDPVKTGSLIL